MTIRSVGPFLYRQYRDKLQTSDLLEWRSESLLGTLIRARTGQKVNHTGAVFRYNLLDGDPEDIHRYTGEALGNGFDLNLLSRRLTDFNGEVYWLPLKSKYNGYRSKIATHLIELEGVRYDYFSILKNIRRNVKIDNKRVFCSEAVHIALVKSGLLNSFFNGGKALVPGEFDKTELFEQPIRIY